MKSEIFSNSISTLEQAVLERNYAKERKEIFILTNGCFDLLHSGHVYSLVEAAKHGNSLWVAINSDESVRLLKGDKRPIVSAEQRAYVLNNLKCVNGVITFSSERLTKVIMSIKPDVYVKSSDYDISSLDPAEKEALEKVGAKIEFVPLLDEVSTSNLIKKIRS